MEAEGKFELIEKYFKNELSGKQLVIFEKRLQNEPELLQEVELQRRLVLAIK